MSQPGELCSPIYQARAIRVHTELALASSVDTHGAAYQRRAERSGAMWHNAHDTDGGNDQPEPPEPPEQPESPPTGVNPDTDWEVPDWLKDAE